MKYLGPSRWDVGRLGLCAYPRGEVALDAYSAWGCMPSRGSAAHRDGRKLCLEL
jgi:hypothetical protein